MARKRNTPRLISGLILLTVSSLAPTGLAQDLPADDPVVATHDALLDTTPILVGDVRASIRAARRNLDRKVRRAAYESVVPQAERLATQQPGPESAELLTVALLGADRYPEALDAARGWVISSPESWQAQHYLGLAHSATEGYEAAVAPLIRAMELAPAANRNRTVARSLGFAFEKLRRFEEAQAVYRSIGDDASVTRMQANIETLASLEEIDDGTVCIEPYTLHEETERLEAALKALEEPSP
ncbi:MAG: hypothetical protein AAF657_33105 [Acidobacteriota bacterium]